MGHGHEGNHAAHVQAGRCRVEAGVEGDRGTAQQPGKGGLIADLLDETTLDRIGLAMRTRRGAVSVDTPAAPST